MTTGSAAKGGFRELEVVDKVARERHRHLLPSQAAEAGGLAPLRAGQFLVFQVPGPDGAPILRNYSVSSAPHAEGTYRISVKREGPREPGLPHGLGSGFLHDRTQVGDRLLAEGPRGAFVLDAASPRPVVLLSGGVGLTPMVSMLHALARTDRRAIFVHACDNGDVHALRDEVEGLVASRPGLAAHVSYRFPTDADRASARHHGEGILTREVLQSLLPLDDYDFYLCGPPPFMRGVYEILRGLGVQKARIAYEFFGPASLLEAAPEAPAVAPASPAAAAPDGASVVTFAKSGITAVWDGSAESLLAFAEDQGLSPEFSCRAGICSTCRTRLVDGEIDYFEDPLDEPPAGEVLICCARPRGSVSLDL